MKRFISLLIMCAAFACLAEDGVRRLVWQVETSDPVDRNWNLVFGETVDFEVRYLDHRQPMDVSGATVVLHAVTNGMPSGYSFQATGSVYSASGTGWVRVRTAVDDLLPAGASNITYRIVTTLSETTNLMSAAGTFKVAGSGTGTRAAVPIPLWLTLSNRIAYVESTSITNEGFVHASGETNTVDLSTAPRLYVPKPDTYGPRDAVSYELLAGMFRAGGYYYMTTNVHPDVAIDGQTTYQAADQNSIPDYGYITVVAPTNGQVLSRTASAMKLPSGTVLRSPATLERYVSFAAIHPLAALSLRARFGISYDGTNFATSGFASGIYECSPGVTNQAVFTHSFADLTLTNDAWIVADTSVYLAEHILSVNLYCGDAVASYATAKVENQSLFNYATTNDLNVVSNLAEMSYIVATNTEFYKLSATNVPSETVSILDSSIYGGSFPHSICMRGSTGFVSHINTGGAIIYRFADVDSTLMSTSTVSVNSASVIYQLLYDERRDLIYAHCSGTSNRIVALDPVSMNYVDTRLTTEWRGYIDVNGTMCQDDQRIYVGQYSSGSRNKAWMDKDTYLYYTNPPFVSSVTATTYRAHCSLSDDDLDVVIFGSDAGLTFMRKTGWYVYAETNHTAGIISDDMTLYEDNTGAYVLFASETYPLLLQAKIATYTNGVYELIASPELSTIDIADESFGVQGGGHRTIDYPDLYGGESYSPPVFAMCGNKLTQINCHPDGTKDRIDYTLPNGPINEWGVTPAGNFLYTTYEDPSYIYRISFDELLSAETKAIESPLLPKQQIYGYYTTGQVDRIIAQKLDSTNSTLTGQATINGDSIIGAQTISNSVISIMGIRGVTNITVNGVQQPYNPSTRTADLTVSAGSSSLLSAVSIETSTITLSPLTNVYYTPVSSSSVISQSTSGLALTSGQSFHWINKFDLTDWSATNGITFAADIDAVHGEFTVTGCYEFASSVLCNGRIQMRQTYPEICEWKMLTPYKANASATLNYGGNGLIVNGNTDGAYLQWQWPAILETNVLIQVDSAAAVTTGMPAGSYAEWYWFTWDGGYSGAIYPTPGTYTNLITASSGNRGGPVTRNVISIHRLGTESAGSCVTRMYRKVTAGDPLSTNCYIFVNANWRCLNDLEKRIDKSIFPAR